MRAYRLNFRAGDFIPGSAPGGRASKALNKSLAHQLYIMVMLKSVKIASNLQLAVCTLPHRFHGLIAKQEETTLMHRRAHRAEGLKLIDAHD